MSDKDLIVQDISDQITIIRDTLLDAGYSQTGIAFRRSKVEKASDKAKENCLKWLVEFKHTFVAKYKKTKELVPAHVWANYKSIGIKGTYEQNQLEIATNLLKLHWGKRPSILTRKGPDPVEKVNPKRHRRSKKVSK